MKNWQEALVSQSTSIRDVIEKIDRSAMQIALVVDERGYLLGTVTDGDVRRGILKGLAFTEPVTAIMRTSPTVARPDAAREAMLTAMKRKGLHHLPLVDEDGIVVGLDTLDEIVHSRAKDNWVVLMAGGLGSRLQKLTENCPKPMLRVGNKPLLETILESFIEYGFSRFYISVNYMAEVVKSYFGDGSRFGVEIRYLHETKRLGTAGALSLLPEQPKEPFFVMNGDLLTKVNFSQLLEFHASQRATATMCVREYDHQVPYGVVKIDNHHILSIEEKPVQRFFVNAGIYVLAPEALSQVEADQYFDMPALFEKLILDKKGTVVFPVREYWLDVGHLADYERANGEYQSIFS